MGTVALRILEIINDVLPTGPACLDAVRIGTNENDARSFIWVGIETGLVSEETAKETVVAIKALCNELGVSDFEVELRYITLRLSSKLLDPDDWRLMALKRVDPYCHTLGTPISTVDRPDHLGTGGLLLRIPGFEHLFMLTAHHVVNHDPEARLDVSNPEYRSSVRFGTTETYEHDRSLIDSEIETLDATLRRIAERKSQGIVTRIDKSDNQYARSQKAILGPWRQRLEAEYGTEDLRTFAHTFAYPEMRPSVNANPSIPLDFVEDWALIQIDIRRDAKNVNVMNRLADNFPLDIDALKRSRYLRVDGFLSPEDLGARSHPVLKNGAASGITSGVTNPLRSFVRHHQAWSLQQGVLLDGKCESSFSAPGDSGSTNVDRQGRVCGLLTSGVGGQLGGADISYCTPMWWILERIRRFGLDASIV
jgi:hypothetical protein